MTHVDLTKFELEPLAKPVRDPEKEIAAFERARGVELPADYRAFLLEQPMPVAFGVKCVYRPSEPSPWADEGLQTVEVLYGLGKGEHSIVTQWRRYSDQIDAKALPIALAPGGNQVCLIAEGPKRGKVYFWDHEGPVEPDDEDLANMYLVAKSFPRFLEALTVAEPTEPDDDLGIVEMKLDF
jgi:SMI1-KNR4 cell-wall